MLEIKSLGEIIAIREMEFITNDGKKEKAFIKIGKPYEHSKELDWCCPYELSTESHKKLFGMVGIDSIQALELTMKTISVEIEYWEKTKKGKFHFLDEEGAAL
ncbi:MAG: hypothetical protein V3V31_07845 [Methylococcales bacterium]